MRIVKVDGEFATAELEGVKRKVCIAFVPDVKVGDYVMVHAGYAISVLEEKEASEMLDAWRELLSLGGDRS